MAEHKRRHSSQSSDVSDSSSSSPENCDTVQGITTMSIHNAIPSQPQFVPPTSWGDAEVRPSAMEPIAAPFYEDLRTMSRRSSKRKKRSAHKCRSHCSHMPPNYPPNSSSDSPSDSDSNGFSYGMEFTPNKTPQMQKKHRLLPSTSTAWANISASNSATATAGAGGPVQMPPLSGGLDIGIGDWSNTSKVPGLSTMFPFGGVSDQWGAAEPKGHSMEELERMAHRDLAQYTLKLQDDIKDIRKDALILRTDLDRMRMEIGNLRGMWNY